MTIGTALVIIFGMLCGTFLITIGIGLAVQKRKNDAAAALTSTLTDEINKRIKKSLGEK